MPGSYRWPQPRSGWPWQWSAFRHTKIHQCHPRRSCSMVTHRMGISPFQALLQEVTQRNVCLRNRSLCAGYARYPPPDRQNPLARGPYPGARRPDVIKRLLPRLAGWRSASSRSTSSRTHQRRRFVLPVRAGESPDNSALAVRGLCAGRAAVPDGYGIRARYQIFTHAVRYDFRPFSGDRWSICRR